MGCGCGDGQSACGCGDSHEGHDHAAVPSGLKALGITPVKKAQATGALTDLQASYKSSLNIWIQRFAKAQEEIRKLESEVGAKTKLLEMALEMLTDEQLEDLATKSKGIDK